MEKSIITFLFGIFLLHTVKCQQCPYGWYGYSLTSDCYRFMTSDTMTWQDARDFCQVHGGDLVKFKRVQDMNWVYGRLKYTQQHNHIPASNWWTGISDREQLYTWEWTDGTPVGNFIQWAPKRPNSTTNEIRCGEIVNMNKINDEHCSNKNRFICSRDRGIPLNCDADHGWQTLNGQCYKVFTAKRNFRSASSTCNHNGGSLVVITGQNDNIAMHDFAVNNKQPFWIGLSSLKTGPTTQVWQWTNGTQLGPVTYWNGVPRVDKAHLNSTCVVVSNNRPTATSWNPSSCNTPRAFVCQKPEGVCAPGWIGHRSFCYQIDVQYRQTFGQAARFCQNQGAELLRLTTSSDQAFIQGYLQLMKDSGVPNFWIGASDNNVDAGPFKWRNGQAIGTFQRWSNSNHKPTNVPKKQDCAYINTNDRIGLWRTTTSCNANRAFVCRLPMGKAVKVVQRTPAPHYGCPPNWKLHGTMCYFKTDRAFDWLGSQKYCQGLYTGSNLVKIDSADVQGFVNSITVASGRYWIGLNDQTTEGSFTWADNSALSTYSNWAAKQPNSAGLNNCARLNGRKWSMVTCNNRLKPVCQKPGSAISPSIVQTTPGTDWTLKCGIGWESNPLTNYCYKFVDSPLSWQDARNDCKHSKGGDLVSIETFDEQSYISGRLTQMTSVAVWTGANDISAEGGWKWADGKPFAFFNWAQGEPDFSKGQSTDCAAMFTQTGYWDDTNCLQRNGYICEKPEDRGKSDQHHGKIMEISWNFVEEGILTTIATTTKPTRAPPAGMVLGCPPYWLPFGDNCFQVSSQPSNWQNAEKQCGFRGSKLASINNVAEQKFIVAHLPKAKLSWDGLWIGLNDIQSENQFAWADGNPVTFTYWNKREPNSFFGHDEDCVEIRIQNGGWNDESCQSVRPGFVCKRPKQFVSSTQSPDQVGCPRGSKGYGPYCYKQTYNALRTWTQANGYCRSALKGRLATINDRYVEAFVTSMLYYRRGYFWIGLSDRKTRGSLLWATGESVLYTNWGKNHTGNERSTCVTMRSKTPAGIWDNQPCNSKYNFICQFPRKGYTPVVVTQTPPPSGSCPTGWTANWDMCYQAFTAQSQWKTWMDAVDYCKAYTGDLASFHNYHNDSFLPQFLAASKVKQVWIGFNDRDTEGGHKWSDGTPVDYTNWNPGEPNNYKGQENCVAFVVNGNGGGWNDMTCYWPQPFVCAIPRGTMLTGISVPPTVVGSPQCGTDPNWNFYNNYCYWVSPSGGDNSRLTYYDAENFCHTVSATLASIHDEDENNNVLAMTHKTPGMDGFWIGLNQLSSTGLKWTDGTPLNYDNFFPNQPDDYLGSEDCVEFRSGYSGEWNDDHCTQKRRFICKKPTSGAAKYVTPPPFTPGGCKGSFVRAPGGRNKCFYLGGASQMLNYTAAVAFCNSQGPGYDLASIENPYEQQFMMTMARGSKTGIWIGLSDRRANNQFLWHDNHPVIYLNWDVNEPSSSNQKTHGYNQNCVMARMYRGHEGRWADVPCSQKLRFLCEAKQDPDIATLGPPQSTCPKGYSFFQNGCYMAKPAHKKWTDAQADCQADGGNLVSVLDVFESAYVGTLTATFHQRYWIGLSDTKTQGIYQWADNNRVLYTNWAYGEPSYDTNGIPNANGCVFAKQWNGRWNDSDCTTTLPYVCKINKGPPIVPTQPPVGSCPVGQPYNSSCYYVSVNTGRSWPEARYICKGKGMELVSIHSKDEMDHVFSIVKSAPVKNAQYTPNIWIGLSKGQGGAYSWSDGSPVNFLYWTPGEPTNLGSHGEEQQCIEFDRKLETWDDVHCFTNRGFVCKGPQVVSTLPPVTNSMGNGGANVGIGTQGSGGILPTYIAQTDSPGVRPGDGPSLRPGIKYPSGQNTGGQQVGQQQQQQQTLTETDTTNNGMSSGAIAGVVLGTIIVLICVAFLLIYLKRSKVIKVPEFNGSPSSGFDNALYSKDDDKVKIDSDA